MGTVASVKFSRLRTRAGRVGNDVGTRNLYPLAVRSLARTIHCRRFACSLADADARGEADVVRSPLIVTKFRRFSLPVSRHTVSMTSGHRKFSLAE